MGRFSYDPNKVSASISTLPKNDYEVIVGEPKAYAQEIKSGAQQGITKYGVRYPLVVADGEERNKAVFFSGELYVGDSPSDFQNVMKGFQLAALGYPKNEEGEARFNAEHGADDWDFNPDNGAVGEGWQQLKGKRLIVSLDVTVSGDRQFQKFVAFRTLDQA